MSFDEKLFQYFWNWKSSWQNKSIQKKLSIGLQTKDFEKLIQVIGFFILETPIQVCQAEGSGGAGGFIGHQLFLPTYFLPFQKPELQTQEIHFKTLVYRVLFNCAQVKILKALDYSQWNNPIRKSLQSETKNTVLEYLNSEFPKFNDLQNQVNEWIAAEELFKQTNKVETFFGIDHLYGLYPLQGSQDDTLKFTPQSESGANAAQTSEHQGKNKEFVTKTEHNSMDENPVIHILEKVHTVEEYSGNQRQMDGSDELQDHKDALDEINMRELIRTNQTSNSVYKTNLSLTFDSNVGDNEFTGKDGKKHKIFKYDEWSSKKNNYLKNWCQLSEFATESNLQIQSGQNSNLNSENKSDVYFATDNSNVQLSADDFTNNKKEVQKLRQLFWEYLKKSEWIPRQMDGFELDLEACIDRQVDLHLKKTPSEKIYKYRKNSFKDLSSVFLFDTSLSTDSYIGTHRILDLEKKSIHLLGEALKQLHFKIEVSGFSSETRHSVRYQIFKDFHENWNQIENHLRPIQPAGYTRMGPPLRHAIHRLNQISSEKKMILLFTDAKPTDYDAYEGMHGIQDIAKAVSEGRKLGIDIFAVTLDKSAQSYFTQMFGRNKFCVVKHPNDLAKELMKIYLTALT